MRIKVDDSLADTFCVDVEKLLLQLTLLTEKGGIDFFQIYYYFHKVKHLAENALTELDNLQPKVEVKS